MARNHDAEYRNAMSTAVAGAVLLHLLLIAFGGSIVRLARDPDRPQILGYRGPTRVIQEIDLIEPNSIQSYFHQRRREGRRRSPEYRLVERLKTDEGPEPVAVREPVKKPDPRPTAPVEDIDLVEPVMPVHREIAFSQEFVILRAVEPTYPEYEASQRVEGFVVVALYVTPQGEIDEALVIESRTIPPGGSPRAFELAALEAVQKWRIQPPKVDGEARATWIKIPINFDLTNVSQ